jgi:hypothetical protein
VTTGELDVAGFEGAAADGERGAAAIVGAGAVADDRDAAPRDA